MKSFKVETGLVTRLKCEDCGWLGIIGGGSIDPLDMRKWLRQLAEHREEIAQYMREHLHIRHGKEVVVNVEANPRGEE